MLKLFIVNWNFIDNANIYEKIVNARLYVRRINAFHMENQYTYCYET